MGVCVVPSIFFLQQSLYSHLARDQSNAEFVIINHEVSQIPKQAGIAKWSKVLLSHCFHCNHGLARHF
jgi:hypothetical protein